jgi:hypothetical protein
MKTSITYIRIRNAIEKNGECFLCDLEAEIEKKYLDTYLQELVMDPKAREKIIKSRGFCNDHSYKMLIEASKPGSADGNGIALINENIVEKLIKGLHKQKSRHTNDSHKLFSAKNECPACIHVEKFAKTYAEKVAELLCSGNEEFSRLVKESKGFCIPHLVTLLDLLQDVMPNQRQLITKTLMEIEERNLQRLNSELAEYIRRQSYEFSEKDRVAVADVVLRSVEKIAGRRGIKPQPRARAALRRRDR